MDFSKYNQVPTEPTTAKEIGLAAATLSAMARRGLVEVIPGKPNKYRRLESPVIKIHQLLEENKDDYQDYFTLFKKDAPYGMLCSLRNSEVIDCWGNKYDLTNVVSLETRTRRFDL